MLYILVPVLLTLAITLLTYLEDHGTPYEGRWISSLIFWGVLSGGISVWVWVFDFLMEGWL